MHVEGYVYIEKSTKLLFLDRHLDEIDALNAAKKIEPSANGCFYCCRKTDTDSKRKKHRH